MVNCLIFTICYFWFCKKSCFKKDFCPIQKWMTLAVVNKNIFKVMTLPNNWYLLERFKIIILCSIHSIFIELVFCAEIWFVKCSTRIVKYESRVIKSNPIIICFLKVFWTENCLTVAS